MNQCNTCFYYSVSKWVDPCATCMGTITKPNWTPKTLEIERIDILPKPEFTPETEAKLKGQIEKLENEVRELRSLNESLHATLAAISR